MWTYKELNNAFDMAQKNIIAVVHKVARRRNSDIQCTFSGRSISEAQFFTWNKPHGNRDRRQVEGTVTDHPSHPSGH
jgi:hypothetical protein